MNIGADDTNYDDDGPFDSEESWNMMTAPSIWRCGGGGFIVTCIDDLCHGAGECMHGDGEMICPECHGRNLL